MKLIPTILVPEPTIPFAQYDADVSARDAEIERLRARNKRLEEALGRLRISAANYEDEDPALRAALKQARAALEEDK